ncbi:MAG: hypothetical protein CME59_19655 [Halioglobus sp.]|nr:hypothetical protein [Halioglobus sp.]|tara:strand:- start:9826 stop:10689 length:864 start_codon:yes stop_codon:yes gene_type:complete
MNRTPLLTLVGILQATATTTAVAQTAAETALFRGHNTHVVDRGTRPAVVLVHGLGADVSKWHANIDVLAQTHRVLALDLLGFGQSDKPNVDYRIQVYVDQIRELLDSRGIEQATLVGNSMGGLVSLQFAAQHPERVKSLVLVAPAFVFGLPNGLNADQLAGGANPQTLAAMKAYLNRIYHEPVIDDETIASELMRKRAIGDGRTIERIARSLASETDVFSDSSLRKIVAKTLVVHGTSDGVVPVDQSRHLVGLLPNATLIELEETGHWPQIEAADEFNTLLLRWEDE